MPNPTRRDRAVGHFAIVYGGRLAAGGASFLAMAIAAQALGPARFGRFAVLVAVLSITAGLVGPALDLAMVRFASRETTHPGRFAAALRAGMRYKAVISVLILVVGAGIAGPIQARFMPPGPGALPPYAMYLALAGAAIYGFWGTFQAMFQARERFAFQAGLDGAHAVLRLAGFGAFVLLGYASETSFIIVYGLVSLVLLIPAIVLNLTALRSPEPDEAIPRDILVFARWLIVACIATSLAQGLDVLLLGWFDIPGEDVGYYRAALTLVLVVELAVMSLFQVLLPKASQLTPAEELSAFLRHYQWRALPLALCVLPAALFAGPVVRIAFGPEYEATPAIFAILLVGAASVLTSAPAGAVVYSAGRSHLIAGLEVLKLVLILVGGLWAAPRYGIYGMAVAVASVRVLIALTTFLVARAALKGMVKLEAS